MQKALGGVRWLSRLLRREAALPAVPAHAKRPATPRRAFQCVTAGPGEVAEWSIAPHSKCGVRASVPGVRIPPSPPEPLGTEGNFWPKTLKMLNLGVCVCASVC